LEPAQQMRRFLRATLLGTPRAALPNLRDAAINEPGPAAGCLETPQIALDELTLRAGLHAAYCKDSDPHRLPLYSALAGSSEQSDADVAFTRSLPESRSLRPGITHSCRVCSSASGTSHIFSRL